MTIPVLVRGLGEGLNVAADFAVLIGTLGARSANDPLALSFNLDDLDKHEHMIEHDGSLSRGDAFFGDNHTFNMTIWQTVLDYFEDSKTVNFTASAKARWNRITTQRKANPDFVYNAKDIILSYGETALYLSVLGDPVTGHPPIEWVRVLFGESFSLPDYLDYSLLTHKVEEQRLPYKEGWRPRTTPTTMASVLAMEAVLVAAGDEELPEGLELTENTLKNVLSGQPLDSLVGNL
jgi:hypothetical protein